MTKQFLFGLAILLIGCQPQKKKDAASMVPRIPEVEKILSQMTIEEKVGQMAQVTLDVITIGENEFVSDEPLKLNIELVRKALVQYKLGSILNVGNNRARSVEVWHEIINQLQEVATKETRLGIPIIYGIDAIHGTTYTAGATFFPQQIEIGRASCRERVYI